MDTLSLCLIVKDETEYLQEWVDYHRLIGVDRFYIYDNGSRISVRAALREEIGLGIVSVVDIEGDNQQMAAYDHCLLNFGDRTQWMGFIDADEFIVPKTHSDLPAWLLRFNSFGGVGINWVIFGSNGHLEKPPGGVLSNYTRRTSSGLADNQNIKSIVRPECVLVPKSPHHFIYKPGFYCVNENGYRIDSQHFPHSVEQIQVNHYWSRSKAEFEKKKQKWDALSGWKVDWDRFDRYEVASTVEDRAILETICGSFLRAGYRADNTAQDETGLAENLHRAAGRLPITHPVKETSRDHKVTNPRAPVIALSEIDRKLHPETGTIMTDQEVDETLLEATRLFPTYPMFLLNLAERLVDRKQFEQAWAALLRAREITSDSYETLMRLGYFFQKTHEFSQAEMVYRLVLRMDPDGYQTHCRLAEVFLETGRFDQAYEGILPVLRGYPFAAKDAAPLQLIRLLCVRLYQSGKATQALELAEFGLDQNPQDLDLLVSMGKMNFDLHQDEAALGLLLKAAQLAPNDPDIAGGLRAVHNRIHSPAQASIKPVQDLER